MKSQAMKLIRQVETQDHQKEKEKERWKKIVRKEKEKKEMKEECHQYLRCPKDPE